MLKGQEYFTTVGTLRTNYIHIMQQRGSSTRSSSASSDGSSGSGSDGGGGGGGSGSSSSSSSDYTDMFIIHPLGWVF
jgi:hypothetical protein